MLRSMALPLFADKARARDIVLRSLTMSAALVGRASDPR